MIHRWERSSQAKGGSPKTSKQVIKSLSGDLDSLNYEMVAPNKQIPTFKFVLTFNVPKIF